MGKFIYNISYLTHMYTHSHPFYLINRTPTLEEGRHMDYSVQVYIFYNILIDTASNAMEFKLITDPEKVL